MKSALILFFMIHTVQRTECFVFNMRILDYSYNCYYGVSDCNVYISTNVKFGDSPNCNAYRRHAYDCICCTIDTCRPKTCSCLHGAFSPDTDSKLISNKTRANEAFATIRIAVHEQYPIASFIPSVSTCKFCTDLPLRIEEKELTLHPIIGNINKDNNIKLQIEILSDYEVSTAFLETTHEGTDQSEISQSSYAEV